MLVRFVALALVALLAAPVWAQADGPPEPEDAPAMDATLLGQWSLATVEATGTMGRFGASLASMTCAFGANGQATVRVVMEQDGERYDREHTFTAEAADGTITSADQPVGTYEMLADDTLRLSLADGLVVQMERAR